MLGLSHPAKIHSGALESVGAERKQLSKLKSLSLRLKSIVTGAGPLVHGQMPTSPAGGEAWAAVAGMRWPDPSICVSQAPLRVLQNTRRLVKTSLQKEER